MNSIDSVSDGSNVIHLNSVNNSVQAVYSTVLPVSLMEFFTMWSRTHSVHSRGEWKTIIIGFK